MIDFSTESMDDLVNTCKEFMGDDFTGEGWCRSELIYFIIAHIEDNMEEPNEI